MKKIFLMLVLIATAFTKNSFAQDSIKAQPSQLLTSYYQLKDNLVKGNTTNAAASAGELAKAINGTDKQTVNESTANILLSDANAIAQSTDIKLQREKFATLSNKMFELAQKVKLSPDPIYQQYCPMKKASWLSNDKAIKNPYYGNAMLTCGSVKTTL